MLIGEAQSKCQHIAGVPLRPDTADRLYEVYLTKGVHATTHIEGNTLSEEQVREQIEGKLRLPKSQQYLGIEVQNIIDACGRITDNLLARPDLELTPELILGFNRLVLRGLEVGEDVRPGECRTHSVGVGSYRGAPWEDCTYLVARLCEWLKDFNPPNDEMRFAFALIKAILTHLYIAWIHPFGDGNGRTARLIEYMLLVQSGVPMPAGHLLSNHYNKTRARYYMELERSSKPNGGPLPFLEYAIQGFVDGLREQLDYIRDQQWNIAWENYIHDVFRNKNSKAHVRQKHLILDMPNGPVARKDLRSVSSRVAVSYADKGEKTLTRDINALLALELLVARGRGYAPNRDLILAFLPPKCEEQVAKPEGMLF